ncbi:hypothetical protein [Moorena producens]|nr:hypothetical protein [Moorena producens]
MAQRSIALPLPIPCSLLPAPCSLLPKTQEFVPHPIQNFYS